MEKLYQKLPYDLAGARSKNRFRNEMLWGLEKIFEVYKSGKKFCMIFDYVCDLELHMDSILEFYQIKTSNGGSPYTINKITSPGKDGRSIFGKIYILKHIAKKEDSSIKVKIAIVVNTPIKDKGGALHSSQSSLELIELDEKSRDEINKKIKAELSGCEHVDLTDSYYIFTSMDLINPQDRLLGKTVNFFVELTGKEPKQVKALYRLLTDTISIKANYELECKSYEDVKKNKGISSEEFEKIFQSHIDIASEAVEKAKKVIDENYKTFGENIQMNNALAKVVRELTLSRTLKKLEKEIAQYIYHNLDEFNTTIPNVIQILMQLFSNNFTIEYDLNEKKAFFILILAKMREGSYETDDN